MKRLVASAAIVAIAAAGLVVLAVPAYAEGGSSANAEACLNGGWQNLTRGDGSAFTNQGDCVAFAVRGGRQQCRLVDGTYGNTDLTDTAFISIDWTCNGMTGTLIEQLVRIAILTTSCADSFAFALGLDENSALNTTCGTI